jgi:hypothetical protein
MPRAARGWRAGRPPACPPARPRAHPPPRRARRALNRADVSLHQLALSMLSKARDAHQAAGELQELPDFRMPENIWAAAMRRFNIPKPEKGG